MTKIENSRPLLATKFQQWPEFQALMKRLNFDVENSHLKSLTIDWNEDIVKLESTKYCYTDKEI